MKTLLQQASLLWHTNKQYMGKSAINTISSKMSDKETVVLSLFFKQFRDKVLDSTEKI